MSAEFETADHGVVVYDTNKWVAANKERLLPPVCNKCMFSDQLKVFFVGGPNSRKDYHLEEGEEIFYQIKGDMVLKVVENGIRKDITIAEGEIFLLPSRVEHSPQRFADSIGCVVERDRSENEMDCIRYFTDETDNPKRLWERWFHLNDVEKDLPPVFKEFFASDEYSSGKPGVGSFKTKVPYEPQHTVTLSQPINLEKYIDDNLDKINDAPHVLFGGVTRAQVILYGNGIHDIETGSSELVLLFQRGEGRIVCGPESTHIRAFQTTLVKANQKFTLTISNGVCLTARISPK